MTDTVAVTGAEGFIGSHLVEALVRRGHRVRGMVLYNMFSSTGWLETLDPEITDQVDVVFGDVRDPATVRELVEGASVVYHLAAIGSVPYSYSAPRSFIDTNTIGTMHVLEAVRACRTPRLVHTSTSETYGTARTVPSVSRTRCRHSRRTPPPRWPGTSWPFVSFQLRRALGHAAAVRHLRPAPAHPRSHPAGHPQLASGSKQLMLGALEPDA